MAKRTKKLKSSFKAGLRLEPNQNLYSVRCQRIGVDGNTRGRYFNFLVIAKSQEDAANRKRNNAKNVIVIGARKVGRNEPDELPIREILRNNPKQPKIIIPQEQKLTMNAQANPAT